MSRALAELATGAVDDDARQDEHHAGDTQQMGEMLQAKRSVVMRVDVGHDVDGHIKDSRDDHHGESKLAGQGKAPKLVRSALYR